MTEQTEQIKRAGRPRYTDDQLHTKQIECDKDLTALLETPRSKRTANQLRRIEWLVVYARRLRKRLATGRWQ